MESGKAVTLPQPKRAPLEQPLSGLAIDVGDLIADIEINVMNHNLEEPRQRQQPCRHLHPADHLDYRIPRVGAIELVKRRAQTSSGGIQVDLELETGSWGSRLDFVPPMLGGWIHV